MKRRFLIGLMAVMVLCCLCGAALAASDPLKVSMDLSQNKFSATQDITVTITVANTGEGDMPGPVTLYYPNGKQVEEFGSPTLAVGQQQSWSGTWSVTQKQLDAGKITFKLKYSIYDDNGELVNKTKNFSKAIIYSGASAQAQVEVNRTITPTTAQKGQEVTVVYDVINAGDVDITDVTIKENSTISKSSAALGSVPAGGRASHTFTVKMGSKDLTSQPTITYKVDGKTMSAKKDKAVIKNGQVNLTAKLSCDKKGGVPGDVIQLTLEIKNTGKTDFTNITVTDPTLGTVFSNLTLAAGKSETLTKDVTITNSADYLFTLTATDSAEQETVTTSGKVSVTAVNPDDQVLLTVDAACDRETIYTLPGTVRFTITVTNNGQNDVKDVTISASGVKLYSFPTIEAGQSRSFSRDLAVSMAGQYQFEASCLNLLQETVAFKSNILPIAYAQPTPVPTEAPIVTPPQPVYEEIPTTDGLPPYVDGVQQALNALWIICLVLTLLSGGLLAAGLVRRAQQKAQSDKAYDHLERGTYRDYSTPAPKEKHKDKPAPRMEAPAPQEEAPADPEILQWEDETGLPAQDVSADEELMEEPAEESVLEEPMQALYPRTGGQRPQDTVPQSQDTLDAQPEPDAAELPPAVPAASAAPRHRRARRHQAA